MKPTMSWHLQQQNDTPQQSINLVHIHLLLHFAKVKQIQHGSLVGRGANGGLAGSDVRILSKSSRKCTVTGIDHHQINESDIVQCLIYSISPSWLNLHPCPSLKPTSTMSSQNHMIMTKTDLTFDG